MQAVPTRWLGLLILVLLLAPHRAVTEENAAASAPFNRMLSRLPVSPIPASIAVDSIDIAPLWFSPVVSEAITFAFAIQAPARARVGVTAAGQSDTLAVPMDSLVTRTGRQTLIGAWDGRGADSLLVTDGPYALHVIEGDSLLTAFTSNTRQFVIDTVAPQIDSFRIDPRPYTPTLPGSAQDLEVRFWISGSQLDDVAGVDILHGEDTLRVALVGGFGGDGGYVAPCRTCADELEDGVHRVEIFGLDRAGNEMVAVDSVDTNLLGPSVRVSHPTSATSWNTMQADSIVGLATDRQPVETISLLVSGALDTTLSLSVTPGADSTSFSLDVSELFAAEGHYSLRFPAVDADGVSDSTRTLQFMVDRTPPPRPMVSPPLPQEVRYPDIDVRIVVDSTASQLLIEGAAVPIAPVSIIEALVEITLPLSPGTNTLTFRVVDRAGNESATETAIVVRRTTAGLSVPEQFKAGNAISIIPEQTASSVQVRILALDGSLVRVFEDPISQTEYSFTWDLTTPEGIRVRNGAYLVIGRVEGPGGTQRYHKMIAVIE